MKIIAALLVLLPFFSCAQAPGYQVVGEVAGLPDGSHLYLIDGGRRVIIDSATATKGRFVLAGRLAEPAHMYLHLGRGRASYKLADILLDNRRVTVAGSKPVYDSVTVGGSDIDQHWKEWYANDAQLAHYRFASSQVRKSLLARQDTANARALKQLANELQLARVKLLKTYVRRYHDSAAGAALPTMCTLGPSLTQADYLEMYNVLTPNWQQSAFGKEIITQARKKATVPLRAN